MSLEKAWLQSIPVLGGVDVDHVHDLERAAWKRGSCNLGTAGNGSVPGVVAELGLNQPLAERYSRIWSQPPGHLGNSLITQQSVLNGSPSAPVTIELPADTALVTMIPIAVLAAGRPR